MAVKLDGSQKVTISVATMVALAVGLWSFHGWLGGHLDKNFFSEAEAQTLSQQVKQAADAAKEASQAAKANGDTLNKYISQQDLKSAREQLAAKEGQLSETQLWETANQPNDISRARKRDLQDQINVLKL